MGHYFIDSCSFWVSNTINYIMTLQQIDFTKVINDEQVYEHVMDNYDQLGKDWIAHQWKWMNAFHYTMQLVWEYVYQKTIMKYLKIEY